MSGLYLSALVLFLLFSVMFGMFGVGGGAVYTPIQLFIGASFNEAATVSLFLIAATSISSGIVYVRARLVDWVVVGPIAFFSLVGSVVGGWSAGIVPEPVLLGLFSFFLLINGLHLAFSDIRERCYEAPFIGRRLCFERTVAGERVVVDLPLAIPIALLSGAFGGMVGLGGGIVMLPLMVVVLRFPVKAAIATSSFLAFATGIGGFVSRLSHTAVPWKFMLASALLVSLGSLVGARWTVQSQSKRIRRLLGLFFVGVAMLLFIRGN